MYIGAFKFDWRDEVAQRITKAGGVGGWLKALSEYQDSQCEKIKIPSLVLLCVLRCFLWGGV